MRKPRACSARGSQLGSVFFRRYRFRLFALRSCAAACFLAFGFFAEPLRALGPAARLADFATTRPFAVAVFFVLARFAVVAALVLATLAGLSAFAAGVVDALTFSTPLGGDAFEVLRTSFAGGAAGVTGAAGGATVTAFVLPFGRPPFRANWASASILRNASWASFINWTCETRRSRSALSFSARYIASAVVASIVKARRGSTISTGNGLNLVEKALSDRAKMVYHATLGLCVHLSRHNPLEWRH